MGDPGVSFYRAQSKRIAELEALPTEPMASSSSS
jgi:hypothetical protein